MSLRPNALAAMYPKEVLPHPLIPTRTMDAFDAKIRVVSSDDALRIGRGGSGVLGPLEFTADRGLLDPVRAIERLEGLPMSIALYLRDVVSAVVICGPE